jgi:hypothetical protein
MEPAPQSSRGHRRLGGTFFSRRPFQLAGVLALLLIGIRAYGWTQGGGESSLNPIAQAAVRTQQALGGRTSFDATVRGQPLPRPIEMTGQGLFNGITNRSQLTMTVPTPSGQTEMEGVGSGSHFYLRSELLESSLPDGDEWIGFDMSLGSSSEFGAVATASPSGQLGVLRAVSNKVEELGEKKVRGVETTGYRSTLDPDRYAEYFRSKGSPKVAEEYERLAQDNKLPSTIEVETWIDVKGLVRQTTMQAESRDADSGEETLTKMTVDFYDFGMSPDIQLPDPDTVYDATRMIRSKLGLEGSS